MKYATFDIEAYNWTKLKTIGFYDGKEYHLFTKMYEFLDFVLVKKYRNFKFFAHFGGGFDFHFILPEIVERRFKIDILEKASKIMLIKLSDGKNTWSFTDSYFMLPQGQKKLAEAFKVKHQKTDIDFDKLKESDFYKEPMLKRLRNDTIGLYEIIKKYKTWGLNRDKLKPTLASQSLYIFRNRYLKEKLYTLDKPMEELVRNTYYGGRVEIFKMYGKSLNYYDINSLYPFVMTQPMPVGRPMWTTQYKPERIGFYMIEVDIPYSPITFIPYVHEGKLYFPYGKFTTYVTSAEIELLIEEGINFKVKTGLYFSGQEQIFKKYINDLYDIKVKAKQNTMDYMISKLLMNSLYGKFGQRRKHERIVIPNSFKQVIEEGLKPYYEELGIYKKEEESQSVFILPYISSYITSLARCYLYREMRKVGYGEIYYCDTDSIITGKRISCSEGLGGWKLEYGSISEGIFLQPKTYMLSVNNANPVIRIKGMPTRQFSVNDFRKALTKNDISIIKSKYYKITGLKESLVRFKKLGINRVCVEKQLKSFYSKREILSDYSTKTKSIKDLTAP